MNLRQKLKAIREADRWQRVALALSKITLLHVNRTDSPRYDTVKEMELLALAVTNGNLQIAEEILFPDQTKTKEPK